MQRYNVKNREIKPRKYIAYLRPLRGLYIADYERAKYIQGLRI